MPHMSAPDSSADVLVIGAGPAGSTAAALLAHAGHHVVCIERGYFPRYSIGESLLPRCNELLAEAGLLEAVEERRYMVKRGARFKSENVEERFCFANGLPGTYPTTFQVPRDDFDQTLATRARALGADVRFGLEAEAVEWLDEGVRLSVRDRESDATGVLTARFLLDCSGFGRVLPRLLHLEGPKTLAPRGAYFTMVEGDERPSGDEEGDIWITTTCGGPWIWIIPFADGRTSVGAVAPQATFDALSGCNRDKLWTLLRADDNAWQRLSHAQPVLQTMKLSGWSAAVDQLCGPRWAIAGSAGDFLDPVFSSGVCLAMESSSLAAGLITRTLAGEALDWQTSYVDVMAQAVRVFRVFVEGWYAGDVSKLFFAKDKPARMRRAITSILAGYVRDQDNPVVQDPQRSLQTLLRALNLARANG